MRRRRPALAGEYASLLHPSAHALPPDTPPPHLLIRVVVVWGFPYSYDRLGGLVNVSRDEYRQLAFAVMALLIAELRKLDITLGLYSTEDAQAYFLSWKSMVSEMQYCGSRQRTPICVTPFQRPRCAISFLSCGNSIEKNGLLRKIAAKKFETWNALAKASDRQSKLPGQ